MNILGIIVEYNPFHNGHLYHLKKAKEISGCNYIVAIMSGNFVQRGEPAIVDKWTRAKMAIDSGVDLVIELPTIYAVQSAEFFAHGAIKVLNDMSVVNAVVFGSEVGDLEILDIIASILATEPLRFKESLRAHLSTGDKFPVARSKAIGEYLSDTPYMNSSYLSKLLSSSNNILAIEYLKAIKRIRSKIKPFTIKRIGEDYNSTALSNNLSSATAIRNRVIDYNDLDSIKMTVPKSTLYYLNIFYNKHNCFNSLNNYNQVLLYLLRTVDKQNLKRILDVDEGLENRIIKCANDLNSIDQILECIKTKRYTLTRLQRIMTQLLLGINQEDFMNIYKNGSTFLRVLAANRKGLEILSYTKKHSQVPIITKFANVKQLDDKSILDIIEHDVNATNIFYLGLTRNNNMKTNLDYITNPYIRKDYV